MRNLLSANLARLLRSRIFWLIEAGIFAWGTIAYFLCKINTGNGYPFENGNVYFFNEMTFIGITIACFCGFFIGTDYSDGTIRTKLAVGHSRKNIYLANFITVLFAGIMQLVAYKFAACTVGYVFMGRKVFDTLYEPFAAIVLSLLSVCGSAAITTFLSMVIMDKPKAVLANMFVSLLILAAGISALKSVLQPETIKRIYKPETGQYQFVQEIEEMEGTFLLAEDVPNPKYLTGIERKFYECAAAVLPGAQGLCCSLVDDEIQMLSGLQVTGTTLLVSIMTVGGIVVFRRKDIR